MYVVCVQAFLCSWFGTCVGASLCGGPSLHTSGRVHVCGVWARAGGGGGHARVGLWQSTALPFPCRCSVSDFAPVSCFVITRWTGAPFVDLAVMEFGKRLDEVRREGGSSLSAGCSTGFYTSLATASSTPLALVAPLSGSATTECASCTATHCLRLPHPPALPRIPCPCPYQILRIRVTHEELLSLLRAEEITQLRVGAAFKPFSSINVRQATFVFFKAHAWVGSHSIRSTNASCAS